MGKAEENGDLYWQGNEEEYDDCHELHPMCCLMVDLLGVWSVG